MSEELNTEELELFETEEDVQPEELEMIAIDDQEVPLADVMEAYKNKNEWQKSNTQKAQEIAAERQRLEEERKLYEQREADLRSFEQRMYQQATPPQQEQPLSMMQPNIDLEDLDPATRAIYEQVANLNNQFQKTNEEREKEKFIQQTQSEHQRLKSQYSDYDPVNIERSLIQGRNQFEDAYLAEKYKAIQGNNKDAIKQMIPQDLMDEIRSQHRKEFIEEARKKQLNRKNLATPQPGKTALSKLPPKEAKSWTDVRSNARNYISENNLSLTD